MLGEEYDSESKQLLEELLAAPKATARRTTQRTRQRPLEPKSAKGFGKGMAMDLEPLTKVPEKEKTKSRKLLEESMDKPTLLAKRFQAGGEARSNPMLEQAEMTLLLAKTGEPSISFGAAFQAARALGRETFDWRGKPYRAQTAEEARGRLSLPRGMKESDLYRDPAQEGINKEYYDATQAIEKDYQQSLRDISSELDTRQKRDLQPYTSDMVPFERNQEALRELDRHMAGLRKYEEDELIQGTVNEEVQKAVEQDRAEMDRLGKEIAFYESLLRLKNYEDAERDADAQVNAQRLKGMEREQAVQPVYPEMLLPGLPRAVRGAAAMLDRLRGGKPRSQERKEPTMNFQKGGEARQDENFSARAQLDSFRIPVEPRVGLPPMEDDYTRAVNYFERMTPEQQRYINEKSRLVQSVRGGVPDFETRNTTSAYGAEMGPYGKVFMGREAKNLQRSLAHEMTHAVDDSLERLYEHARKNPDTPLAKQFVALYRNLGEQTRPDDAKRLSPEWYKSMQTAEDPKDAEWGRYRTNQKELGAWGAGIMFSTKDLPETVKGGTKPTRGGLHVDPTLTTQLEILKEFGAKYADELMRQSAHEMYVPPYVAPPQAASVAPKRPTRSKKSSSRVRPIKRAEGGDVSRETLDARSYLDELNARDDPIRSGKPLQSRTRKKATPEENEALNRAVLQGVANMPYNMAGAPVDLLNMLLTPAGLGSKQPVMGSDWIKQKMTDLGVRPEPPTDPTQRALYSAADLGSSLVNPAAPVRAAAKGAEKAGEAARMLAEDFQRYNQALGPAGASHVIKPKGGNWLEKSISGELQGLKRDRTAAESLEELAKVYPPEVMARMSDETRAQVERAIPRLKNEAALNSWIDRNLTNYIKKEMATPEDPVRALAEQGVTHLNPDQVRLGDFILPYRVSEDRQRMGVPEEGIARSPEAKAWEGLSDAAIQGYPASMYTRPLTQEEYRRGLSSVVDDAPWLTKLDPNTQVYTYGGEPRDLGFDHIVDVLRDDLQSGRLRPEQLSKVSMEQAVRRTAEYDQEKAKEAARAALQAQANLPVVKQYDQGYKWLELHDKADAKKTEEALDYEGRVMGHCVGSYCPEVLEGKTQIFSLRDAKGEPHVTIEVTPQKWDTGTALLKLPRDQMFALRESLQQELGIFPPYTPQNQQQMQEAFDRVMTERFGPAPASIEQIKGKGNAAPKEAYLPFVQDFIKSGNWSVINDVRNAGLRRYTDVFNDAEQRKIEALNMSVPDHGWLTGDQIQELHNAIVPAGQRLKYDAYGNIVGENFAQGGLVNASTARAQLDRLMAA
jgi:hypothetical protein